MVRTRLVLAFVIVALLQAYILYYLFTYGNLIGLIQWDDCAIVLRGISNIDTLAHATSILSCLAAVWRLNIHAPTSDLQTMVGLLLTGGSTWGPYALNAVYLLASLYFLSKTAALKSAQAFWLATALFLFQPLTWSALSELKSDWQGGLLMASAIFILFDAQEEDSNAQRFIGSGFLSAALLTKMTSVYVPVLAAGVLISMEIYGALRTMASTLGSKFKLAHVPKAIGDYIMRRRKVLLICLAIVLLPFILLFIYQFQHLADYIKDGLSPRWRDGFSLHERLYLYRPAHNPGWGRLHLLFVGFFVLAVIAAAVQRNGLHILACLGVAAISTVFFIPLLLAATSNVSFSGGLLGTVLGAVLVMMRILAINAPRLGAPISTAAILVAAVMTPVLQKPPVPDRAHALQYQAMDNDIVDKIIKTEHTDHPRVLYAVEVYDAPYPNLAILHFRRTARLLDVDRIAELKDVARMAAGADYVLTMTQNPGPGNVLDVSAIYPLSADLAAADRVITASGGYELLSDYPLRGGTLHLYRRLAG